MRLSPKLFTVGLIHNFKLEQAKAIMKVRDMVDVDAVISLDDVRSYFRRVNPWARRH